MKKNKKRIIIILIILVVIGIIGVIFFQNQENRLTRNEREWITNNQSTIQNINVVNDVNFFGKNGNGIYYNFLEELGVDYNLQINKITTSKNTETTSLSFMVGNNLPESAFLFYEDHYVLVGKKEENITSRETLTNKTIGVLASNLSYVQKYLTDVTLKYTSYKTEEELITALDGNDVAYILVPRMEFIDTILNKKYWITYHFGDIKRNYYVTDDANTTLYQIIKKYYNNWSKDNLKTNLYEEELLVFKENLNISDTELDELQRTEINYGYKVYTPYNVYGSGTFGGIIGEYLKIFKDFAKLDLRYSKYNTDRRFTRALDNSEITLFTNFYNYSREATTINTNLPLIMGVYVNNKNPIVINSTETLVNNKNVYVEENTLLANGLASLNITANTFTLSDIDKVLKDEENIILLDTKVGSFLQRTTLEDYDLRYQKNMGTTYAFKSTGNEVLNTLLSRYVNYLDNESLSNIGYYNGTKLSKQGSLFSSFATYALFALIVVLAILLLIYRSSKKVKLQKKVKKEDKLKFVDHLTTLKNRNYLNENLSRWNKNTIYPQSVIVIDLNKVQEINDTLGYEEGDKQIQAAANVLIKTQLDNTDIIRTNGNEFMIYLVGFNQKQITSYIHKLNKEFNNLPYQYGVCISYSMIMDDLKSIEDAINECVEAIKTQKSEQKDDEQ